MTEQFEDEVVCLFEKERWPILYGDPGLPFGEVISHILSDSCSHCAEELNQNWQWYQHGGPEQPIFPKGLPTGISSKEEFLSALLLMSRREDELDEHRQTIFLQKLCTPEGLNFLRRILNTQAHLLFLCRIEAFPQSHLVETGQLLSRRYNQLQDFLGQEEFEQFFGDMRLEQILEGWHAVLERKRSRT